MYLTRYQSRGYWECLEICRHTPEGVFTDLGESLCGMPMDMEWLGMWRYPYSKWDANGNWVEETETAMGFGAGGGIEYNWQAFAPDLPPIWWNLEAGIGSVPLDYYNFSAFMIGLGAHYRF